MMIDILMVILLVMAVVKGYRRGLIVAVFSVLAFIIGLAAALKLSAVTATYIGEAVTISDKWLPVIAFAVVFVVVILLVRLLANFIQKTIEFALLGWVNRLGGILVYGLTYIIIFSIILFYGNQVGLVKPETRDASVCYPYIEPVGPGAIELTGKAVPFFKDMFSDLQEFFGSISHQVPAAH